MSNIKHNTFISDAFFVEVVLPLAVADTYTYHVPAEFQSDVSIGCRVSVQFGKNKIYSAIITNIHQQAPLYPTKPILALLDEKPIVLEFQLDFWRWISQYYICHLGEVMSAALPNGLKLSSETKVVINNDFDGDISLFTAKELAIIDALTHNGELTIMQIAKLLQQQKVIHIIRGLLSKKVVLITEEVDAKYKPKIVEYLTLSNSLSESEIALSEMFDLLNKNKRTYKQMLALMAFVKLCNGDYKKMILKSELLKEFECSSSSVEALLKKGVFISDFKKISRLQGFESSSSVAEIQFTPPQSEVIHSIEESFKTKEIALLHGVTGSGKTEIYIHFIKQALDRGEQVLYLLPEIALTSQIVSRLRRYFGDIVGVYHSKFNENEQVEIWEAVIGYSSTQETKKYSVILGARSAIFLPYTKLGLIIVDEEHDSSFKQIDPAPRYHARDSALYLASIHNSKTILGSATPSIESYWNALSDKYALVTLDTRFSNVQLPATNVVDLKHALKHKIMKSVFSEVLIDQIKRTLDKNEQVILFQNRRGFAPIIECQQCQYIPKCIRCDVSLTYHKKNDSLTCHYCGYAIPSIHVCPSCSSTDLKAKGLGTEKIEEELSILFPDIKIGRIDQDTSSSKVALLKLLTDFENQKIQVLVGTQMITKGLDFGNVSLVGVINADSLIAYPDFRSFERAFQLMVQVSGRSGRKEKQGQVIIQSYNPSSPVIDFVINNNYLGMFQHQISERRNFHYPPFVRLIKIVVKHPKDRVVVDAAKQLASLLQKQIPDTVLGPEYPMISMINNYYLNEILIKIDKNSGLNQKKSRIKTLINQVLHQQRYSGVKISIDVDPQ